MFSCITVVGLEIVALAWKTLHDLEGQEGFGISFRGL